MKLSVLKSKQDKKNTKVDMLVEANAFAKNGNTKEVSSQKKIRRIEFAPAIFPRYIELNMVYAVKNEIIENIMESERMVHIYTQTCGIKYGSPICIGKENVERVMYL